MYLASSRTTLINLATYLATLTIINVHRPIHAVVLTTTVEYQSIQRPHILTVTTHPATQTATICT